MVLIWPARSSFALKWFWPGLRATTLPLRVIFKRFVNDLFVFTVISYFLAARSITVVRPLGLLAIGSPILYSSGISFKNRSKRSLRKPNSMYLYRPHRKRSTLTRCPSRSHSAALLAFKLRSFSPVPIFTWTLLVSVVWDLAFISRRFFSCSYWNLPYSIIFATGGTAPGEISIRSNPSSSALAIARDKANTPKFSPTGPITRTSVARI